MAKEQQSPNFDALNAKRLPALTGSLENRSIGSPSVRALGDKPPDRALVAAQRNTVTSTVTK